MPELTGNAALDVLIGLSFVYLLFSLVCSAIQEGIAGLLDLRAKTLIDGLRNLLNQHSVGSAPEAQRVRTTGEAAADLADLEDLQKRLYEHPLVDALYTEGRLIGSDRKGPSYLPPRTFAIALLDLIAPKSPADDPVSRIRDQIEAAKLPAGTKQALLAIADEVGTDRDSLRRGIMDWFNGAMARVSGWYRRKAQVIISVIALLVTVGFNVDTLVIGERLVKDETVRVAVAQQGLAAGQGQAPTADSIDAQIKEIKDAKELGLPLGWTKEAKGLNHIATDELPAKLAGLGVTFIMLSLGAPFWFDTLTRLARLRTTGDPVKAQDTDTAAGGRPA